MRRKLCCKLDACLSGKFVRSQAGREKWMDCCRAACQSVFIVCSPLIGSSPRNVFLISNFFFFRLENPCTLLFWILFMSEVSSSIRCYHVCYFFLYRMHCSLYLRKDNTIFLLCQVNLSTRCYGLISCGSYKISR